MSELGILFGSLLITFFGVTPDTQRLPTPEYECETPVWTAAPEVKKGMFYGTIEVTCLVRGEHGGGFPHLKTHMEEYLLDNVETVHAGPTSVKYEELPSVFYDVTMLFASGDNEVRARGENYIGSDDTSVLVYDFFSKEIDASGMAGYMKKVNIEATAKSTESENWYAVTVSGLMEVEKPWFAPSGTFKKQIVSEIEKQVEAKKEEVITEVANNI